MTTTWASVSKQIGAVKPETKAIAKEIYEEAKKAGHEIWYIWGTGTSPEHSTKLALDLMIRNEAGGDWVRNYIWKNRERLRLRHVIWEQHITSTVTQPGVRRKMEDRGNPTANHYDHIHVWFFAGEYVPPKSKPSAPAKPSLLIIDGELGPKTISLWRYVMRVNVRDEMTPQFIEVVQKRLRSTVDHRLKVDGELGPKTIAALQRYLKSPVDGVISKPKSQMVMALQRRLNTGKF